MPTDTPGWIGVATPITAGKGPMRTPKPRTQDLLPEASAVQSKALRGQTAAQSHNVFRPDIFRVSEGYLN